LYDTLLEI